MRLDAAPPETPMLLPSPPPPLLRCLSAKLSSRFWYVGSWGELGAESAVIPLTAPRLLPVARRDESHPPCSPSPA